MYVGFLLYVYICAFIQYFVLYYIQRLLAVACEKGGHAVMHRRFWHRHLTCTICHAKKNKVLLYR